MRGEVGYLLIKRQDFRIKEFVNEPVAVAVAELKPGQAGVVISPFGINDIDILSSSPPSDVSALRLALHFFSGSVRLSE